MPWPCPNGCESETSPGKPRWHGKFKGDDCPKMPKGWKPPKDAPIRAPAPPEPTPPDAPPITVAPPKPKPGRAGAITFSESKAEVIKGGGGVEALLPERVDFIVDKEHTLGLWNFGFHRLHDVTILADWALGWEKHMPMDQFQVSKTGQMSIEMEPRNIYARSATFFCKRMGCQTLEQAHSLIDSVLFFEAFAGIAGAIFWHYKTVLKESPKLAPWREKRAKAKALKGLTAAQKAAATPAASTVVSEVAA